MLKKFGIIFLYQVRTHECEEAFLVKLTSLVFNYCNGIINDYYCHLCAFHVSSLIRSSFVPLRLLSSLSFRKNPAEDYLRYESTIGNKSLLIWKTGLWLIENQKRHSFVCEFDKLKSLLQWHRYSFAISNRTDVG